jgi:hypothetical protein
MNTMHTRLLCCTLAILAVGTAGVRASLVTDEFTGFNYVDETGVSGLTSSYYYSISISDPRPNTLPELGPGRVNYPSVGQYPSGGREYDEGVLGWRVEDGYLIVRVANGLNPLTGHLDDGAMYGQGDMFLTVEDSGAVRQFALLNSWARNGSIPITLGGTGYTGFNTAQAFHVGGMEGHMVLLNSDSDVAFSQGYRTYSPLPGPYPPPQGVDSRVFAQGGVDLGSAGLTHEFYDVSGSSNDWYIQTWAIPLQWMSGDGEFDFSLHMAPTCANDQIAMNGHVEGGVPEPATLVLTLVGVGLWGWRKRAIV